MHQSDFVTTLPAKLKDQLILNTLYLLLDEAPFKLKALNDKTYRLFIHTSRNACRRSSHIEFTTDDNFDTVVVDAYQVHVKQILSIEGAQVKRNYWRDQRQGIYNQMAPDETIKIHARLPISTGVVQRSFFTGSTDTDLALHALLTAKHWQREMYILDNNHDIPSYDGWKHKKYYKEPTYETFKLMGEATN